MTDPSTSNEHWDHEGLHMKFRTITATVSHTRRHQSEQRILVREHRAVVVASHIDKSCVLHNLAQWARHDQTSRKQLVAYHQNTGGVGEASLG
jgi:hypothetical protein